MAPTGIAASFWRGGTSRGLLLRAQALARFSPSARQRAILTALGSPDPDGRQIDGLGGGVSSLSKVAIVGLPGEASEEQLSLGALPGVEWADEGRREGLGSWDLVYRFGQVSIRQGAIDWQASCGNMLAAAALAALSTSILPYSTLFMRAKTLPPPAGGHPLMFPLNILSASNGALMRARVPIDPFTLQVWEPAKGSGTRIAGVPGEGAGIEVEMPIQTGPEAPGGLPTRNATDVLTVKGEEIKVSIVSSGLPNVFVPVSNLPASLNLPQNVLTLPSSAWTSHPSLLSHLEAIRRAACATLPNLALSSASPKVCLIGPVPTQGYTSSSGVEVKPAEADLLARTISSGDPHATIPGTTLGALNLALGIEGTVVQEMVGGEKGREQVVEVRAAHMAGVASARVRFAVDGTGQRAPESVVMWRTAREIMRGEVLVDEGDLYDDVQ